MSIPTLFPRCGSTSKVWSLPEFLSRPKNESLGFINENPELVPADNAMAFLSDDGGETYNRCHCECIRLCMIYLVIFMVVVWSNFEIGDMDFWRQEAYSKFFDYLDEQGGFYYEVRPSC